MLHTSETRRGCAPAICAGVRPNACDQLFVGARMDELRRAVGVERVDRQNRLDADQAPAAPVENLAAGSAGCSRCSARRGTASLPDSQSATSRSSSIDGMSTTPTCRPRRRHISAAASASCTPRPLLTMTAAVVRALAQDVPLAELERVVAAVDHRRRRAHHADVEQPAVALHDPLHQRQHLLRARDVDDLEVRQAVEDRRSRRCPCGSRRWCASRSWRPSPASSGRGRGPRSASRPAPRSPRAAPDGRRRSRRMTFQSKNGQNVLIQV